MAIYKRVETKNNRTIFFVNGKMKSPKELPQEVLRDLQAPGTVELPDDEQVDETPAEQPERTDRSCLFCGKFGNFSKFLNGQTIYLCEEDYKSHTTGEVAQKMREEGLFNSAE